ncbi:KAP family P-loop NTPase fold protein [Stenotrophomonas maltophilia]|uniref:KAP family P-loop NTPase fold protein n=1 Tax=Stenotrophomonas maltophilia TaxID=40324 RepID=UPI0011318CCD|nr:P-loop NTPase fold protein [Stenotrophomonas maltophilia]
MSTLAGLAACQRLCVIGRLAIQGPATNQRGLPSAPPWENVLNSLKLLYIDARRKFQLSILENITGVGSMDGRNRGYHGDKPIRSFEEDSLGFGGAARLVANSIHSISSPDGFVIGVEGEWGSGKSSFVNLVVNAMREKISAAEVVHFLPWLISSRDGMLYELFSEIINAAVRVLTPPKAASFVGRMRQVLVMPSNLSRWRRTKRIKRLYSNFSGRVVQAARLADMGLVGGVAGTAVQVGKDFVDSWIDSDSLVAEKAKLSRELAKLERKIVLIIDDLDRLEPREVVEVLRLVRAVVDFPNMVFVLCYSRSIIAKSIESSLSMRDGGEFLDKIVQVSYPVSRPEAFDLRQMLRVDVKNYFSQALIESDGAAWDVRERLERVIDFEGGIGLSTPRQVVRVLNSLRLYGEAVADKVDIADLVWLQLIRLQSYELFQWIEYYLMEFAVLSSGSTISDAQKKGDEDALRSIVDSMRTGAMTSGRLQFMSEILPGFKFRSNAAGRPGDGELSLYEVGGRAAGTYHRRLSSSHHYRLYFAFATPHGAISEYDFAGLIEESKWHVKGGVKKMRSLARRKGASGDSAIKMLIGRLEGAVEWLPSDALPGLIYALVEVMDEFSSREYERDIGSNFVWYEGQQLFSVLWSKVESGKRLMLVSEIFADAPSIGWLTEVFRSEVFSHGIFGGRADAEQNWIFSAKELEVAASNLISRFREMHVSDVHRIYRILPFLYALVQYDPGVDSEVREKVSEWVNYDDGLLIVLERMRGWRSVNGVVSYPLYEEHLERFLDLDMVKSRLSALAAANPGSPARNLLGALAREEDE